MGQILATPFVDEYGSKCELLSQECFSFGNPAKANLLLSAKRVMSFQKSLQKIFSENFRNINLTSLQNLSSTRKSEVCKRSHNCRIYGQSYFNKPDLMPKDEDIKCFEWSQRWSEMMGKVNCNVNAATCGVDYKTAI